jgi:hypothetical protein
LFENERRISELSGNFAGKRRVKELKKLRKAEVGYFKIQLMTF